MLVMPLPWLSLNSEVNHFSSLALSSHSVKWGQSSQTCLSSEAIKRLRCHPWYKESETKKSGPEVRAVESRTPIFGIALTSALWLPTGSAECPDLEPELE